MVWNPRMKVKGTLHPTYIEGDNLLLEASMGTNIWYHTLDGASKEETLAGSLGMCVNC